MSCIPARPIEGELILGSALGGLEGCRNLGDRAPAKRKRDVFLELAHEHVRRQTRVAHLLGEEEGKQRVAAPCPPVLILMMSTLFDNSS